MIISPVRFLLKNEELLSSYLSHIEKRNLTSIIVLVCEIEKSYEIANKLLIHSFIHL